MAEQTAFQIEPQDNVATALMPLAAGTVMLLGDVSQPSVVAIGEVPIGHKLALRDIHKGENILKYNVVIGRATEDILTGTWVHLHNICSVYDERSSHLDAVTGAPKDTKYE